MEAAELAHAFRRSTSTLGGSFIAKNLTPRARPWYRGTPAGRGLLDGKACNSRQGTGPSALTARDKDAELDAGVTNV
jgi:hypothetical protein